MTHMLLNLNMSVAMNGLRTLIFFLAVKDLALDPNRRKQVGLWVHGVPGEVGFVRGERPQELYSLVCVFFKVLQWIDVSAVFGDRTP